MKKKIKLLEDNLINKIAAGEVIERPASIVKELVENSIDAGATCITIEIKNGGTSFIKITDNGSGIEKSQIKTAFLRHSTNKLEKLEDLDSVLTLGFRGEALASIASISEIEFITKSKEDRVGTRIYISGGKFISEEETACLEGTIFTVKNIFFNTPARRKFLKKDSIESGYISEIVNRLVLGHPQISFKYINNGVQILQTLGKGDIKDTVFSIYGMEISKKMIEISNEKNGFKINGIIGLPELGRGNRSYENFFINGRYIKSTTVTDAIEEAYSGKLMTHKFPIFIINMTVPENTVDVNVHPTKLEVRFEDENFIFNILKTTVEKALNSQVLIPNIEVEREKFSNISEINPYSFKEQEKLEALLLEEQKYGKENNFKNLPAGVLIVNEDSEDVYDKKDSVEAKTNYTENNNYNLQFENKQDILKDKIQNRIENYEKPLTLEKEGNINPSIDKGYIKDEKPKNPRFFNNYRIIGQIFNTYWIIEQGNDIFMIDQHSAHEKVIYEELYEKLKNQAVYSQRLLEPIIINVSDMEKAVIEENFQIFSDFGFEIENFGLNCYVVREVPFIFKAPLQSGFFMQIVDMLTDKNINNIYDIKIEKIISMSCKKAVKANDRLSFVEAKALIEKLLLLENPFNCPHGRPTIIKMTKYEIEKLFKRIQN